jgi:hypothetical protein
MIPVPFPGVTLRLIFISWNADTATIASNFNCTLLLPHQLLDIHLSIIFRWRLSLTVPNSFIGTLILYLCLKPSAELVEKVLSLLNPIVELVAVHELVVTEQCQSKPPRWLRSISPAL